MKYDWMQDGNCRGEPPSTFYAPHLTDVALAICKGCPVTEECLYDAARIGDWESVRGGLTGEQRKRWAINNGVPRHGTPAGYTHDRCRCQLCRDVVAEQKRRSRAKAAAC